MQPHQQRVVDEKSELVEKLTKLEAFIVTSPIFSALPEDEQKRLHRQQAAMETFASILGERIAAF